MNKDTDDLLDYCVLKSLRKSTFSDLDDFSVVDCCYNEYLHPDYDPFKMLQFQLMAEGMRSKYNMED